MKILFVILGTLSLILGIVGIALPLLPTTPFLLLSATLYMHSSPRLHQWLINTKWLGSYINDYQCGRGIPRKTKRIIIAILWISLLYSIYISVLWLKILLVAVGIAITLHVAKLKCRE